MQMLACRRQSIRILKAAHAVFDLQKLQMFSIEAKSTPWLDA
jgi:hypothetical protein